MGCPITAATLIADVPELGLVTAKQIAALLGLAPHTRRSGTMRYREPTGHATGHGRAGVRHALFNAARAAIRHSSPFKDFYDRLVSQNRRARQGRADRGHAQTGSHRQCRRPRSPALARQPHSNAAAAGGRHSVPTAWSANAR
jgi:transposase